MINEQNILRFLEGNSSTVEKEQMKSWLSLNKENVSRFNSIKSIWNTSASINNYQSANTDEEWDLFNKRIATEEYKEENQETLHIASKRQRYSFLPYSTAASLALLLGAFFYFQNKTNIPTEAPLIISSLQLIDSQETIKKFTLPDATIVQLDTFSSLEYASSLDTDSIREVSLLVGSAIFDVAHDLHKKFVVTYEGIAIEVLGTKFEIGGKSGQVKISLKSGSIKAYQISNKANNITMKPGDEFTFTGQKFKSEKKTVKKFILEKTEPAVVKPPAPSKIKEPTSIKEPFIIEPKESFFRIRDVLDFLDNKYGKQLKINKRLGVDKDDKIRIDINQNNLRMILNDLEKATSLSTKPGKCDGCYIITAGSTN